MARRGDQTRQQIRWRLSAQLSDHLDSTASGHGDLTRVVDKFRFEGTGTWQGKYLYFPTGTHSGSEVAVVSFLPGSYLGFFPTLAGTVASGEVYEVHMRSIKDYNDAIARAEFHGRERYLVDAVATLTWIGDTYEYTLGGITMDWLAIVETDYVTNTWNKLKGPTSGPRSQWRVEFGDVALLVFDRRRTQLNASGAAMRLVGQRKPIPMVLDSDTCEFPVDYIIERATLMMQERLSSASDAEAHLQRADRALQRAMGEELNLLNPMPGSVPLRMNW